MHRTTTTATLLVTVAVSALSGCVTVQHPPVPGPTAAPSQPSAPRPDGSAEPHAVQAPAREALELVGPSRGPSPTARAPHRAPAPTAPPPAEAAPPAAPHGAPPQRAHPQHPRPAPRADLPSVVSDVIPKDTVPKNADVCALGRKYGGWPEGSPQSTICKKAYGR